MNIIDLLKDFGYEPKHKAASQGGEYSSSCPFCNGGNDRFISWPNQGNGGRFWCRKCDKKGDCITFIQEIYGLSYLEACGRLKIPPKERSYKREKNKPQLHIAKDPPLLWQERAMSFVNWCHEILIKNAEALQLIKKRGFSEESIKQFKLGYNPEDLFRKRENWGLDHELKDNGEPKKLWLPQGIVIPTNSIEGQVYKIKVRRSLWKEGDRLPKYVEITGSKKCPAIFGCVDKPIAIVLESELDGLLIQQFASDIAYCVSLGGSTKPIDLDTDQMLRKAKAILFCPDFDDAGKNAWEKWKEIFSDKIHLLLTPTGKGAGDAYLEGVNLRDWILEEIKINEDKYYEN